jgi:hypothetical protein
MLCYVIYVYTAYSATLLFTNVIIFLTVSRQLFGFVLFLHVFFQNVICAGMNLSRDVHAFCSGEMGRHNVPHKNIAATAVGNRSRWIRKK